MEGGELVDTRQAAAYMKLQPATLEQWRWNRGSDGPPFIRLSARAIRYRRRDLDEWIERQKYQSMADSDAAA